MAELTAFISKRDFDRWAVELQSLLVHGNLATEVTHDSDDRTCLVHLSGTQVQLFTKLCRLGVDALYDAMSRDATGPLPTVDVVAEPEPLKHWPYAP